MYRPLVLHIGRACYRRTRIRQCLKTLGFEFHKARTCSVAKEMLKKHCYRLALLDFNISGEEIFELCSFIRSIGDHTIAIVLMADTKINIEEQLFDCGVNDVVINGQTSPRVLIKRIKAHLRNSKPNWPQTRITRLNGTMIDFSCRQVWRQGATYQLSGLLADLLKYFVDNPNRIISREELRKCPIWADSICTPAKEGGKTFDVSMSKLRKIIETDPPHPQIIISVRGVGWKLVTSDW